MKKIIVLAIFIVKGNCFGQITFQKVLTGTGITFGYSVQQTTDDGYIITGYTGSSSAADEVYLIKTDSNGDTLWTKTYGGTGNDYGNSVQQTTDGGYIIAGYTSSFSPGDDDVYLIKTDVNGNISWTKTFGNADNNIANSVQQTTDGGYIIAGSTGFSGGSNDVYLIKTDVNGDTLWVKTFGGTGDDIGNSVQQTSDGGYVITGKTDFGTGGMDVYLIKTNSTGDTLWTKTFGGTNLDIGNSVQQTSDGGYIITGYTVSFSAGDDDVYLIKTDANGNSLWTKTFGETDNDVAACVQQTADGGYIIAGLTQSFSSFHWGVYLIRADAIGDLLWSKFFGGAGNNYGFSVQQTTDGGYIIGGLSNPFAGTGVYLIKTDSIGNSGCIEGNPVSIVTVPATQVSGTATIVTSPAAIVTNPATIAGSGATVTTLCTTVGLNPSPALSGGEGVAIAPNPSRGNFVITFPHTINKGSIEIYTVLGKKIFQENISAIFQKEIHLKNSAAGIYFVKVRDGEKEYDEKLIRWKQ